jgi:predicted Rossmann fold flavoprotein
MDCEAASACDVLVLGCGPAGLSASLAAASSGASVLALERLDRPGVKLLASGGGRCNLGNTLDAAAFMARFGRSGRFMSDVFKAAPPEWLREFLASKGVECVAEDGFHYFPKDGRSSDILNVFLDALRESSAKLLLGVRADSLAILPEGGFIVSSGERQFRAKAVVIAAGGTAWSSLGGSKLGLELARKLGHSIVKPLPAMAPIIVSDAWIGQLSGVSLKDAKLILDLGGRRRFEGRGELLFTHNGFSGPAALDLSGDIAAACDEANGPVTFSFQAKAGWGAKEWLVEIDSWRKSEPKKLVRTALAKHFPHSLSDALCASANCPDSPCCELKAADRDKLAATLGGAPLTATGAGPMDKAMAMRGGVSLKEVDPKTLESKLVPGLFFAGEVLDLVGPCGGYNIQWAFSSGRLAGLSAASR